VVVFLRDKLSISSTTNHLNHFLDESVDFITLHTARSSLTEVVQLLALEAASGRAELEGPQEIRCLLEVGAGSEDFVNDVLHANQVDVSEGSRHNGVVAQRDTLSADLSEASLVYKFPDRFQVRVAVGNEGLHKAEHFDGGGVDADENTVVQLAQAQELQNLAHLRGYTDDTANTDDEHNLLFRSYVDLVLGLSSTSVGNSITSQLKTSREVQYRIKTNDSSKPTFWYSAS
jgi:hypothetical protein